MPMSYQCHAELLFFILIIADDENFAYGKDYGSILFQLLSSPDDVDLTYLLPQNFQVC